jgi:hypothetical protein
MELNQEHLHSIFEYKDGNLYWKISNCNRAKIGDIAGTLSGNGYKYTTVNKKRYGIHRVIFMMHHGYMPPRVDHKDGNPLNNDISNLRAATHQQNITSQKLAVTNTSGFKNVHWHSDKNKWCVQLLINQKKKHIGYFEDVELADLVAQEARAKYHGEFARNN